MNRDSSIEAIKRGLKYKSDGDLTNALRLFEKSNRLFASEAAQNLIDETKEAIERGEDGVKSASSAEAAAGSSFSSSTSSSTSKSKSRSNSPTRPATPSSSSKKSTSQANESSSSSSSAASDAVDPESAEIVQRIVSATCHYRVLGMRKEGERGGGATLLDFSESTIKKQYRKLALKVHPDKNRHPKAEEAFKKVGEAYQTLSDSQKRAVYDRYGDEGVQRHTSTGGGAGGHPFGRGGGVHFAQDMTPEELFEMFFFGRAPAPGRRRAGGGRAGTTFHFSSNGGDFFRAAHMQQRQRRQAAAGGGGGAAGLRGICSLFGPMFFLMFFSLLTSLFMSDDYFSLSHTRNFPLLKQTPPTTQYPSLEFYVKEDFDKLYNINQKRQIHIQVREEYADGCNREATRVRQYMHYSFFSGSYQHTSRSRSIKTPHCDALKIKLK